MVAAVAAPLQERWPALATVPPALAWLGIRSDLGCAPRTLDAYARGLSEYLAFCAGLGADPVQAKREHIARFVRHLTERLARHTGGGAISSGRHCRRARACRLWQQPMPTSSPARCAPMSRPGRWVC